MPKYFTSFLGYIGTGDYKLTIGYNHFLVLWKRMNSVLDDSEWTELTEK